MKKSSYITVITGGTLKWAGETIIYAEHDYEAEHAITFRLLVLWLKRGVMHSLRPPSQTTPEYRFTFAAFLLVSKKPVKSCGGTLRRKAFRRARPSMCFSIRPERRAAFVV